MFLYTEDWLVGYLTITMPDLISFAQNLNQFFSNPSHEHLAAAHGVLRYIKASPGKRLILSRDIDPKLKAYNDSD